MYKPRGLLKQGVRCTLSSEELIVAYQNESVKNALRNSFVSSEKKILKII